MAVLLALAASLAWGSADYLGGTQTRQQTLLAVIAVSQVAGLAGCVLVVLLHGGTTPSLAQMWPAILGGASGAIAIASFYKALAVGTMSIVAPISATSAALAGDRRHGARRASAARCSSSGMALAFGGAVLAAREPQGEPRAVLVGAAEGATLVSPACGVACDDRGNGALGTNGGDPADRRLSIILAVVAALGIGGMLLGLQEGSRVDPYWSMLTARATSAAAFAVVLLARRPKLGLRPRHLPLLVLLGLLDTAANGLFSVASTHGYLSVVSVIGSLYPVTTIALATVLLRERVRASQARGHRRGAARRGTHGRRVTPERMPGVLMAVG